MDQVGVRGRKEVGQFYQPVRGTFRRRKPCSVGHLNVTEAQQNIVSKEQTSVLSPNKIDPALPPAEDVRLGLELGADCYLAKPVHPEELSALNHRLLQMGVPSRPSEGKVAAV